MGIRMGIRDFLRGVRGRGPKEAGRSPGGSRLLRYSGGEFEKPKFGFTEEPADELAEAREKVYDEIFGKCDSVYHELLPVVPHVDVYRIPPVGKREFFTFVTGGMSDLPMNTPKNVDKDYRRIELVFYASEDKREYMEVLRGLAHFPHDNDTWIHWGHTMPNGTPPEPIFEGSVLDTFFFMPSILRPDSELGSRLSHHGEAVHLVWCVPITTAECNLKLERGSDALYELFEERKHPFVFSGKRQSYL